MFFSLWGLAAEDYPQQLMQKENETEVENRLFSELKEESKDVVQRGFPQIHCYTFADSFKRNSPILVKLILPLQPC